MAYIVAIDSATSNVLAVHRHAAVPMRVSRSRAFLECAFPGRAVLSPMESWSGREFDCSNVQLVSVYVSRNKEGNGRIAYSPFEIWAVMRGE